MPFKTVALGAALTPTVISTCFSHVSNFRGRVYLGAVAVPASVNGVVHMDCN